MLFFSLDENGIQISSSHKFTGIVLPSSVQRALVQQTFQSAVQSVPFRRPVNEY